MCSLGLQVGESGEGTIQKGHDVYICHRVADRKAAAELQRLLKLALPGTTVSVSSDLSTIGAGSDWEKDLVTGIENCRVFIVLCTRQIKNSFWIPFELGLFWPRLKRQGSAGTEQLYPVLIDGATTADLPDPLKRRQVRVVTDAGHLANLVAEVGRSLGRAQPSEKLDWQESLERMVAGTGRSTSTGPGELGIDVRGEDGRVLPAKRIEQPAPRRRVGFLGGLSLGVLLALAGAGLLAYGAGWPGKSQETQSAPAVVTRSEPCPTCPSEASRKDSAGAGDPKLVGPQGQTPPVGGTTAAPLAAPAPECEKGPVVVVGSGTVYSYLREKAPGQVPKNPGYNVTETGTPIILLDSGSERGCGVVGESYYHGDKNVVPSAPIVGLAAGRWRPETVGGRIAELTLASSEPIYVFVGSRTREAPANFLQGVVKGNWPNAHGVDRGISVKDLEASLGNPQVMCWLTGKGSFTRAIVENMGLDYKKCKDNWQLDLQIPDDYLASHETDPVQIYVALASRTRGEGCKSTYCDKLVLLDDNRRQINHPMTLYFRVSNDVKWSIDKKLCDYLGYLTADLIGNGNTELDDYAQAIDFKTCTLVQDKWTLSTLPALPAPPAGNQAERRPQNTVLGLKSREVLPDEPPTEVTPLPAAKACQFHASTRATSQVGQVADLLVSCEGVKADEFLWLVVERDGKFHPQSGNRNEGICKGIACNTPKLLGKAFFGRAATDKESVQDIGGKFLVHLMLVDAAGNEVLTSYLANASAREYAGLAALPANATDLETLVVDRTH